MFEVREGSFNGNAQGENCSHNGRQPMRVSLPERSYVSSTREEIIPDVNESSRDKGKKKVAEVPKFENANDRQVNEAPEQTARPNVFALLGGRMTQSETQLKNCAESKI